MGFEAASTSARTLQVLADAVRAIAWHAPLLPPRSLARALTPLVK